MKKWSPQIPTGWCYSQRFNEGRRLAGDAVGYSRSAQFPGTIANLIGQFGVKPELADVERGFLWELGELLLRAPVS